VKALLIGASGGLAQPLAATLLEVGWVVDLVTRPGRASHIEAVFAAAIHDRTARVFIAADGYDHFNVTEDYDAVFMLQALFAPQPLAGMEAQNIAAEIAVGLTGPMTLTSRILAGYQTFATKRRDFCYIGSTSAYAGFRNSAVYCAVKHGLLGFVRAMNDEYADSDTRFWLVSMGTMNTEMGMKVQGHDPISFLNSGEIAKRIVAAIADRSNVFEPEIIFRRRTIRLKAG